MNPHVNRIAFVDIETTDIKYFKLLNPAREDLTPWAEICEIGIVVATPDLQIIEEFEAKTTLRFPARLDPRAQAVNGYDEKDWEHSRDIADALQAYGRLMESAGGCLFASQNPTFDRTILEIACIQHMVKVKIDYHSLDVWTHSFATLSAKGYKLENYGLNSVAKFLGMNEEPLPHRGLTGARYAWEVTKRVRELPMKAAGIVGSPIGCLGTPTNE
ncbi:MAG: hypothetical protein G01um10143_743 [Parcubacteria group bacterium Gr01-1014_3]|nr:MAG: hypothetical protein G01um10143_743 [Parcubacteria group bacterium Gr01-1014_3]